MRLLPVFFIFAASSLAAEVPDRATLEAPDRIWLRESLNASSELGVTMGFFSYVQFDDGVMTDYFSTTAAAFFPASCAGLFECPNATFAGPIFTAPYEITPTGVSFENITRSDLTFDPYGDDIPLHLESFSIGVFDVPVSLEDGVLVRRMGGEEVKYFPTTIEAVDGMVGMARILGVSVVDNGDCLIQGHIARQNNASPDAADTALLAFAELGVDANRDAMRAAELNLNHTVQPIDLPQENQDALLVISLKRAAQTWLIGDAIERLEAGVPAPEDLQIEEVIPQNVMEEFNDEERIHLAAQLPVIQAAAPAIAAVRALVDEGLPLDAALCPNL